MIEKLVDYIFGYLKVFAEGKNVERFINLCNNKGIELKRIKKEDNGVICLMNIKSFKNMPYIARKSKMRIKIQERYGLPFFFYRHRKRKMFVAGIASGFTIMYVLSLFIWDISFQGNQKYTDEELMDCVSQLEVAHGMKKSDINSEDIERGIRNKYFDIKWVSVEVIGTKLIIHLKENNMEEVTSEEEGSYSLVADKDGIIKSIVTRKGTALVKSGDEVKSGDVLIQCKYDIFDDFGELLRTEYVAADGDVYAQTRYTINEKIKREYRYKEYTGNESRYYGVEIAGKGMDFDYFSSKYKTCDTVKKEEQLVLGKNFYIPIYFYDYTRREYIEKTGYMTDKEAKEAGYDKLNGFLQNLIEKGIQIIENNVKIEVNDNNVSISGEIICYEYIGIKKEENNE